MCLVDYRDSYICYARTHGLSALCIGLSQCKATLKGGATMPVATAGTSRRDALRPSPIFSAAGYVKVGEAFESCHFFVAFKVDNLFCLHLF